MAKRGGRRGGRSFFRRDRRGRFASGGGGGKGGSKGRGSRSPARRVGSIRPGPGGSGRITQNRRNGSVRQMDVKVAGRYKSGKTLLVRSNPNGGKRPPRAPFQKGRTKRGVVVVRDHRGAVVGVGKTYIQKVRLPREMVPGADRNNRTAIVMAPRGSSAKVAP